MRVLGINDSHNASACLIEDGEIVFAIQEERLTGIKNWCGYPGESILCTLGERNLTPEAIDWVAIAGEAVPFGLGRGAYLKSIKDGETLSKTIKRYLKRTFVKGLYDGYRDRNERRKRIEKTVALGFDPGHVRFVKHHTCHAAAAYYGWGRPDERVLVLTNDGFGDDLCATVNIGERGQLRRIAEVPGTESIGTIYAYITALMGMVPLEHEYKIMGMAPYASQSQAEEICRLFEQLMTFDQTKLLVWRRANGCPEIGHALNHLKKIIEYVRFDHLCGGLQLFTERILKRWVQNCVRATGIRKVALGGGTFMNVKANKVIAELPEVEELFVFPSCGDESNAFGAAYQVYAEEEQHRGSRPRLSPFQNIYLGPQFGPDEIEQVLKGNAQQGVEWCREDDINLTTARLLAQGKIVARFHGREEFGARALGNRSILADPTNGEVVRTINEMIKCRDFWMPFAPAVTVENADKYIRNPKGIISPFMMMTYDTNEKRDEFIAAIHPYDFTARMQMVIDEMNPAFYDLLGKFEQLTGRGVILNTSFNLHGSPIVHSPQDALHVLLNSGLSYMTLGDYVVWKKGTVRPPSLRSQTRLAGHLKTGHSWMRQTRAVG